MPSIALWEKGIFVPFPQESPATHLLSWCRSGLHGDQDQVTKIATSPTPHSTSLPAQFCPSWLSRDQLTHCPPVPHCHLGAVTSSTGTAQAVKPCHPHWSYLTACLLYQYPWYAQTTAVAVLRIEP